MKEGMNACRKAYVAGLTRTLRALAQPHGKDRDAFYSRQMYEQAAYQSSGIAMGETRTICWRIVRFGGERASGHWTDPTFVFAYGGKVTTLLKFGLPDGHYNVRIRGILAAPDCQPGVSGDRNV